MSGGSKEGAAVVRRFRWRWLTAVFLVIGAALCAVIFSVKLRARWDAERQISQEAAAGYRVRSGLPNLMKKLKAGKSVHLAFLGGSITQNSDKNGFVTALPEWIRENFPRSRVRVTNAGVAGTKSDWGAKRVERDVLANKPDLVFVEFAVNDGTRNSVSDMEKIVRKTMRSNPKAELVFLYATSDGAFKQTAKGKTPKAIKNHERVAQYYGIPSVTLGSDMRKHLLSGESSWGDIFEDGCHPTEEGYDSYNRDLVTAFEKFLNGGPGALKKLPKPM